jgi:hypothetical protein
MYLMYEAKYMLSFIKERYKRMIEQLLNLATVPKHKTIV